MNHIPVISVIVPIYKVEKCLNRCIDRILTQTFVDFELILIDDGSPDRCGEICNEYAQTDKRVKVIHQTNAGVSTARNAGVEVANGEWIAFVDADDYLDCAYLSNLIQYRESDLIIGGYKIFGSSRKHSMIVSQKERETYNLQMFVHEHLHRLYATVPWGKLFRSIIIKENNLRFNASIRLAEDLIFNLNYIVFCHRIDIVPVCNYYYYDSGIAANAKYNLSTSEIEKTILEIDDAYYKIYSIVGFGYTKSRDYSIAILVSMYPLQNIIQQKDDNIYFKLYQKFFPDKKRDVFYNDHICSPILRFIREIKDTYSQKKYSKGRKMINKIAIIYRVEMISVETNTNIDSLIRFLLLHQMHTTCNLLLILYSIIRK